MASDKTLLKNIYTRLFNTFGPQHWWPGETPFEIIIGAILTQNTNWQNVEKAINNLKEKNVLTPAALKKIPLNKLARLIRPSGYYNIKAKRLKNFIEYLFAKYNGNLNSMFKTDLPALRHELLNVNGIGPETADSILLYAGDKPVFVVDAYTKRLVARHNILDHNTAYHDVQNYFMNNLTPNTKLYNEYHALIVRLGKEFCRKEPDCESCPLGNI